MGISRSLFKSVGLVPFTMLISLSWGLPVPLINTVIFFTSSSGLENKEYDLLEYNIDQESSLDEWSVIYEEVLDEAKALVKLLSKGSLPLPEVGYELCDDKGMIVSEFELAWPKYKIAVTLDEPIEVGEWELFAVEQSEAIIERMKQKVGV